MITGMRLGIIRGINNWYGSGAASVLSTPATEGWLAFNSASIRKNSLRWLRGFRIMVMFWVCYQTPERLNQINVDMIGEKWIHNHSTTKYAASDCVLSNDVNN